jgi:hypothetical protein
MYYTQQHIPIFKGGPVCLCERIFVTVQGYINEAAAFATVPLCRVCCIVATHPHCRFNEASFFRSWTLSTLASARLI